MVVTWIVLGQRDNPLGMGSTVPLGTVPLVNDEIALCKCVHL